jgi:hypothetical protein
MAISEKSDKLTHGKDLAFSGVAQRRLREDIELRTLKRRIRWLIQMTDKGTIRDVAERLTKAGYPVHETTVGRWLDEDSDPVPDALHLAALLRLNKGISSEYILGLRPPATDEERVIERKIGGKP